LYNVQLKKKEPSMSTYVLVPGAWLGGWSWRPVADQLRDHGHDVHAVTLTGLGDRSDLATPEVDLDTYVSDVAGLIETEGLDDVVLVGHSYAGHVVTGVADRIPDRIALLAYLDAGPSPNGAAFMDLQPPEARELIERLVEEAGQGWRVPMPSWEELEGVMGASLEGLGPDERARMRAGATAQPLRTWTQPLSLRGRAPEELPKLLITCSIPLAQVRQMIDSGHPWFAALAGPSWSFLELSTGHWPMFSVPGRLASLLAGLEVPGRGHADDPVGR
jgi:pimeloyl-ACP methyl ester carboxylesterase